MVSHFYSTNGFALRPDRHSRYYDGTRNASTETDTKSKSQVLCSVHRLDPAVFIFSVSVLICWKTAAWFKLVICASLGGDILGGLTVASMLIPQSVSYASSLAKLSPVTGLVSASHVPCLPTTHHSIQFSAAVPGIVYALLGTSRQLNVAPEAALSLLVGQAVNDVLHSNPHGHPVDPDTVGLAVSTIITFQVHAFILIAIGGALIHASGWSHQFLPWNLPTWFP